MKRASYIVLGIMIVGVGAIIWFEGFQDRPMPVLAASELQETSPSTKDGSTANKDANSTAANESGKDESAKSESAKPESTKDEQAKTAQTSNSTSPDRAKTSDKTAVAKAGEKTPPPAQAKTDVKPPEVTKETGAPSAQAKESSEKESPKSAAGDTNGDPNNPMEALNLKDVEMKNLVQKIGEWTGKVVIPVDDAMKQKITVFAPDKLPRKEALSLIYSALRTKGYVAEETDRIIYLKPIAQAKQGQVPTVGPDESLAAFENKEQVVQKFFRLKNYQPEDMVKLIKPLIGEYGDVSADPSTGMVTAIDTVTTLIHVQSVIKQFDVPEAEQAVSDMIRVQQGDPVEIVQMLEILLDNSGQAAVGRRPSRYRNRGDSSSTVIMGQSKVPIVLIPETKRKLIIARASAKDMKTVKDWVAKLDTSEPVKSEYETIPLKYADPREVATRIQSSLENMPGADLRPNVLVQPLEQSHQIMVFGRADLRQAVRELIQEIDIPSGEYEKHTFKLKYADPEQIKKNIDSLYGQNDEGTNRDSYYYYYYLSRRQSNPGDMVRAIAFPTMQQVTVICSPENMRKIEKQIQEWDQPLDVDKVKPQIITLKNSDPVQMAQLLTKLFSEEQENNFNILDYIYGRSSASKQKIIGPLYGQLTFEDVPGTKKIIVISKIPEAYKVIRDLVSDLDRKEMAEVPKVVTIKYADPEDLAERLNALFNERGAPASFHLSPRGLSDYQMNDNQNNTTGNNNNRNNNADNNNNNNGKSNQYQTWWSTGSTPADQEPLSNVIGRVRFIPDSHSKSILVLSPPEFYDSIEAMVRQLDVPGKQVLVKAVIVEVDHSSMTSLGVQLATNPAAFGDLSENSLEALGNLTHLATHGTVTLDSTAPLGATGSGTILGASVDIYALLDFLEKKVHARILNQQSLWTKDNAEANFFKGNNVAFNTNSSVTGTGIVTGAIQRTRVGMSLRVRPSITPEERVDMIVNIILSQLTGDVINTQPVTSEMETTTNMIVKDGQTIMLGGILFQRDSKTEHKLPLLGDLPLVGGLFRHNANTTTNSELIVFITPYVMSDDGEMAQAAAVMKEPLKKLHTVQSHLKQATEKLDGSDPNESL